MLSLVKPNLKDKVEERQAASKKFRDGCHPVPRTYDIFQRVKIRNVRGDSVKWIPGTIVERKGPSTYLVRTLGNKKRFVHADHLVHDDSQMEAHDESNLLKLPVESSRMLPPLSNEVKLPDLSVPSSIVQERAISTPVKITNGSEKDISPVLRRSNRIVRAPVKLDL